MKSPCFQRGGWKGPWLGREAYTRCLVFASGRGGGSNASNPSYRHAALAGDAGAAKAAAWACPPPSKSFSSTASAW